MARGRDVKNTDTLNQPYNQQNKTRLNISDQYASGIQGFEGCRELVQNWIDQCERLCIQQHGGAATLMVPTISISTSKRERVVVLSANRTF